MTVHVFHWDSLLPATPRTCGCAGTLARPATTYGFIARANGHSNAQMFKRCKCRLRATRLASPCLKAGGCKPGMLGRSEDDTP
jgi:hypothetical protein